MAKLEKLPVLGDGQIYGFHCPGCGDFHRITVKSEVANGWDFNGDLNSPTFSPSILQRTEWTNRPDRPSVVCHSFVRNGRIEFLGDCTHKLAGQTVEMFDIDP